VIRDLDPSHSGEAAVTFKCSLNHATIRGVERMHPSSVETNRRTRRWLAAVAAASATAFAQTPPRFTEVAAGAGIDFAQQDNTFYMGAGCAFCDIDADSDFDVILTGGIGTPRVYLNDGDGTFTATPAGQRIALLRNYTRSMGLACADVESDGDQDVLFANLGVNVFARNDGRGWFEDDAESAGLNDTRWSTAAAFGDYDNDGFLDVYVGNYIEKSAFPAHDPWPNALLRNRGDGTFEDVTTLTKTGGNGTTLAVSFSDYDNDGDADLFVGNDFGAFVEPNRLYRNDGFGGERWRFTEVSQSLGADLAIYCMGIAAGDYDGDLDLDYYFTNLGRNVLLRNDGPLGFSDVTTAAGCEGTHDPIQTALLATSWGIGFHDFDHDRDVDLFVSNGYVPAAPQIANSLDTPNFLYVNDGANHLLDQAPTAGVADKKIGRGCAFADYDKDGDVDILQANINGKVNLFRNDAPNPARSLRVVLEGWKSNRDGAGARLVADVGDRTLVREANAGYSFEASNDPGVHFGLGAASEVDDLAIRWPSGIEQRLLRVGAAPEQRVVEPRGTIASGPAAPATLAPGTSFNATFALGNHTAVSQTFAWRLAVENGGATTILAEQGGSFPPGHSGPITVAATLPPGALGESRLVLTLQDAFDGRDQRASDILIR
jgi:ASPIC and UnbV/FG-GAP-like repeat